MITVSSLFFTPQLNGGMSHGGSICLGALLAQGQGEAAGEEGGSRVVQGLDVATVTQHMVLDGILGGGGGRSNTALDIWCSALLCPAEGGVATHHTALYMHNSMGNNYYCKTLSYTSYHIFSPHSDQQTLTVLLFMFVFKSKAICFNISFYS